MLRRHGSKVVLAGVAVIAVGGAAVIAPLRSLEAGGTTDQTPVGTALTTKVTVVPAQIEPGERVEVTVEMVTDTLTPVGTLSARLHLGPDLELLSGPTTPWNCSDSRTDGLGVSVTCTVHTRDLAATSDRSPTFDIRATYNSEGLRGISALAWYGDETPDVRDWPDTKAGAEGDSVLLSISAPHRPVFGTRPPGTPTTRAASPMQTTAPDSSSHSHVTPTVERETGTLHTSRASRGLTATTSPSTGFCGLFAVAGAVDTSLTVGPVTFSSMSTSSRSTESCSTSSVITLSASTISFGDVRFTNVNGSVSPTTMSLSMAVASGATLSISGPFPDSATQYAAIVVLPLGSSRLTLTGTVDYSDSSRFKVTLSASAASSGWNPAPGLSVASGAVSGTFIRSLSAGSPVDTFVVNIALAGAWSPVPGVSVGSVTASIGNAAGNLTVTLGANVSGRLTLAGLDVSMNSVLTGSIDATTGVVTVSGSIGTVPVASLATLGPASATFTYDARNSGNGSSEPPVTATLTGSASFAGQLAQFFKGSVSSSLAILDEGFVVEASMSTSPQSPGYSQSAPTFLWASLTNPLSTVRYSPIGTSMPEVPLRHQSATSVSPFGVPPQLVTALDTLGVDILDRVGNGTLSIGLPPGDPSISIYYRAPANTYLIGDSTASVSAEFDDIFVSVTSGEDESFTIGGDVSLRLSKDVLEMSSALVVASGPLGFEIDGYLELVDQSGWPNAFGLTGVILYDLTVEAGMADGLPSFGLEAAASFPSSLTSPLGIVNDSVVTLGIDVSATNPCFLFAINAPPSNPNQNVLDLGNGTLTATSAQMVIAPDGCQIGQNTYSGFQLEFAGAIRQVAVGFSTSFTLDPVFSLTGSGYVGSFPLGDVTFSETTVNLSISDSAFSLRIVGGISAGTSLQANGTLFLASGGGYSFSGSGTIQIGSDRSDVSITMTNCGDAACATLIPPTFWASGGVTLRGFAFSASIEVDLVGKFDAKLTIPERSTKFTFKSGSLDGSGTLTYAFFVEVSDTGSDEVRASTSVSLSSCSWTVISCKGAKASASADVKTGSAAVSITITYVIKASISVTVR